MPTDLADQNQPFDQLVVLTDATMHFIGIVAQLLPRLAMQIVSAGFFFPPAQVSLPEATIHKMRHMNLVLHKDPTPNYPGTLESLLLRMTQLNVPSTGDGWSGRPGNSVAAPLRCGSVCGSS
jgi:hypothetical protein